MSNAPLESILQVPSHPSMFSFSELHVVSILIATVLNMILGFAWYHEKVFGALWMQYSGLTKESMKNVNMGATMATGLLATFLSVMFLDALLIATGAGSVREAMLVAFLVWMASTVPLGLHGIAWNRHPWGLMILNSTNYLVGFLIASYVLTVWPF